MKNKTPHRGAQSLSDKRHKTNRPIMGRFYIPGAAAADMGGVSIRDGLLYVGIKKPQVIYLGRRVIKI